jgi:hypothetical protein
MPKRMHSYLSPVMSVPLCFDLYLYVTIFGR